MRLGITIIAAGLVFTASLARADMKRSVSTVAARTNATSATLKDITDSGLLWRLTIDVATGTNKLVIADTDGSVILSNAYTGTTTTNFATPIPFVGLNVKGFAANTNAATATITTTFEK